MQQQMQQQMHQMQQQMQQLMQTQQQFMQQLSARASGHVAATQAAETASAEAIAARKEVESSLRARIARLATKLSEIQRSPPNGPGSKTKNAALNLAVSTGMTRADYAKRLRSMLGKDELEGQDVFHIIANSKGGADHPDNYLYALGKTFNRSIGDNYDDLNALLAGKEKTERAIKVSMKYGNALDPRGKPVKFYDPIEHGGQSRDPGEEAERLVANGQKLMRGARYMRHSGAA